MGFEYFDYAVHDGEAWVTVFLLFEIRGQDRSLSESSERLYPAAPQNRC